MTSSRLGGTDIALPVAALEAFTHSGQMLSDALGAPTEFKSLAEIRERWGSSGVTGFERGHSIVTNARPHVGQEARKELVAVL